MHPLGKIVKSNSHTDYVCQIFGAHEAEYVPTCADHAFGTFVCIDLNDGGGEYLVGLIYDTVLLNPDFGRLGPRLSSERDLQIFSPDYLNERAVLVGIVVIGQVIDGEIQQGVPGLAATNEARVRRMGDGDIRAFHASNGHLQLAYLANLLDHSSELSRHLALQALEDLKGVLPDSDTVLSALSEDLKWQIHVSSMRGGYE